MKESPGKRRKGNANSSKQKMPKEDLIIFKTFFSFSNYLSSFDGWPMVQNLRTIYFLSLLNDTTQRIP